ncbi:MAG: adenosylmethionine decarboxylase [Bdellovibrionales bacterium]|nr:adenosylmethionine decarboxylase [Bdellovibrionales bacterium]
MKEFGKHYLVEFIGCDSDKIASASVVETIMLEAARLSNATLLSHAFHQFAPQGVSGFLFIAESHFSIHTWPEESYAGVDIFTCGKEMDAQIAIEHLEREFAAKSVQVKLLSRGIDKK